MPYRIERKGKGFVVADAKREFSSKPLTLQKARAQRIAIILSESKGNKKKAAEMFI